MQQVGGCRALAGRLVQIACADGVHVGCIVFQCLELVQHARAHAACSHFCVLTVPAAARPLDWRVCARLAVGLASSPSAERRRRLRTLSSVVNMTSRGTLPTGLGLRFAACAHASPM